MLAVRAILLYINAISKQIETKKKKKLSYFTNNARACKRFRVLYNNDKKKISRSKTVRGKRHIFKTYYIYAVFGVG